jgi:exopolysaccharide biosynthesis protein
MKRRNKKSIIIGISIFLAVAGIALALAERYLIHHVQITDVSAYSATQISEFSTEAVISGVSSNNTSNVDFSSTDSSTQSSEPTEATQTIISDDWNYSSDSLTISITEHSSGNGKNALTYFVADIVIKDATQLSNAFADNQFGTNITEYTSTIAEENNALFAINGDYYGFRDDGIIIRNGVIYRDEPARIGLAFYRDGTMKIYDETTTSAQELLNEGVWNTLSFGPALITDSVVTTDFSDVNVDHNVGNHPITGKQPRTGVGMISANHFVFIVVDGRSEGYSNGITLEDFAQLFSDLGCTQAYNVDGGGSSTMYFMGRVVNNPLGRNKERGTSDILMIGA